MRTINPATEEPLEDHREHSPAEVDFLLRSAAQAQGAWRRVPMDERGRLLRRAGEVLRGRRLWGERWTTGYRARRRFAIRNVSRDGEKF